MLERTCHFVNPIAAARHAVGACDGQNLVHGALEQLAGLGPGPEHADGRPGDGAERAGLDDEYHRELFVNAPSSGWNPRH
jgi:hypothetical protein